MAVSVHELDDDSNLVLAVQAGDNDAFTELFRRHYPAVRRTCARRLRNMAEADEIAQAAFVRAFERIDRCSGERRFGAWVQVIAQRLCIDHVRAATRTTPQEDPVRAERAVGPNGPEEHVMTTEVRRDVHLALATLPPRQREVVVARDLEERRPTEIAAALGVSVGAVDSLLLRARRRLATSYQHVAGESGVASVSSAASMALGGGAIAGRSSFGRAFEMLADTVRSMANQIAVATGVAPAASGSGRKAVATVVTAVATTVAPGTVPAPEAPAPAPPAIVVEVPAPPSTVPLPVPPVTSDPPAPPEVPALPAAPALPVSAPPGPPPSPPPPELTTTLSNDVTGGDDDLVSSATDTAGRMGLAAETIATLAEERLGL